MRSGSLVAALSLLAGCAPTPTDVPTLCQLAQHRGAYAGRRLTVEGHLLSSRHGTVLSDPRCERGIGIEWRDEGRGFAALTEIAQRSQVEPLVVTVRVTGEVKWRPSSMFRNAIDWYLDLESAEGLTVAPLPPGEKARYIETLYGGDPHSNQVVE